MGTRSLPRVKCGQSVLLTIHPLVVLQSTHPLGHTGPVMGSLYLYNLSSRGIFLFSKRLSSHYEQYVIKLHVNLSSLFTKAHLIMENIFKSTLYKGFSCHYIIQKLSDITCSFVYSLLTEADNSDCTAWYALKEAVIA